MISIILSLIITIACLALIVSIISKRWNALSAIDVEALPAERDARTKKKILSVRLARQIRRATAQLDARVQPLKMLARKRVAQLIESFSDALDAFQRKHAAIQETTEEIPLNSRIERDLAEAERLRAGGCFEESEKRYIDIIAKDAKNMEAYEGLSQIYIQQKEWASAQEVLEFLRTHLKDSIKKEAGDPTKKASIEMRLAESLKQVADVNLFQDKKHEAEQSLQDALDLQPQNPKFLDAGVEMYIILGKKREARAALSRLRETNPDNKKLDEFEARIENI